MNFYEAPITPGRSGGGAREAPSSILNASQSLARWQLWSGLMAVALAGVLPWFVLLTLDINRLTAQAMGREFALQEKESLLLAGLFALVPALNAVCLFRSGAALRRLSDSRLVSDLHTALRRLRTAWCLLGLTLLSAGGYMLYTAVLRWMAPAA